MKFKEYMKEAKQVGTIYHFTTVNQFEKILNDNFKMFSYNGVLSCTRNSRLVEDPRGDISKKRGHVVRFNIDGNKLSNKYITTLNPLKKYDVKRVPLNYQEDEEMVFSKNKKYIDIKLYIKSITVSPINIDEYEILKKIKNEINIPIEFVKKFNQLHEEIYKFDSIDIYELEVLI